MKGRLFALVVLAAGPACAQNYAQRFWFDDGAGIEMHTQNVGSQGIIEVNGGGSISAGDIVGRFVEDIHNKVIFAYELEAHRGPLPGEIGIRLKPSSAGPTVAAVRDFPAVKYGQEVKIEILVNPTTGEKIYDVLRPVEGPDPAPGRRAVQGVWVPKLVVNGKAMTVKSSWALGQEARLYVPGKGAYFLAWEARPDYRLAGYFENNRLIFLLDSEYVEMEFPGEKVLPAKAGGPVWVYRDPNFVPQTTTGGFTCLLDSY